MKMSRMARWQWLALMLMAGMLAACSRQGEEPQVAALPKVAVMTMAPQDVTLADILPGRVTAVRTADIRPQVTGVVQRRLFEQGARVEAGQVLYQINAAPFRAEQEMARAALQRAQAVLAHEQAQLARLQPLMRAGAVSRQEFDDAAARRTQAAADVEQARAVLARRELDVQFASVEAPIGGRIDQAMVTEGALVSPGDTAPLARIQQIDQVYVDVRQPAAALADLRAHMAGQGEAARTLPAEILPIQAGAAALPGQVLFSGISVDPGTGDVLLRILADNPAQQLLPGLYVRVKVPRGHYRQALMLPQEAVVRQGGGTSVWVVDEAGQAQRVPVRLGGLQERQYLVLDGLSAGQRVVIVGQERLGLGMTVAPQPWQGPAALPVSEFSRETR